MPRFLKVVYIGGAVLAVVAFLFGVYDVVIASDESASFLGDVVLPLGMFLVIVALYSRRKRGLEQRQS